MRLVDNWKNIIKGAWSIRFVLFGALCACAEMALPLFVDNMPRGWFVALTFVACIGGAVARLVDQPKLKL